MREQKQEKGKEYEILTKILFPVKIKRTSEK